MNTTPNVRPCPVRAISLRTRASDVTGPPAWHPDRRLQAGSINRQLRRYFRNYFRADHWAGLKIMTDLYSAAMCTSLPSDIEHGSTLDSASSTSTCHPARRCSVLRPGRGSEPGSGSKGVAGQAGCERGQQPGTAGGAGHRAEDRVQSLRLARAESTAAFCMKTPMPGLLIHGSLPRRRPVNPWLTERIETHGRSASDKSPKGRRCGRRRGGRSRRRSLCPSGPARAAPDAVRRVVSSVILWLMTIRIAASAAQRGG
jgi:hypothetical protein